MNFQIDNDELRESYERQQHSGLDAKQTVALLNSLIEKALNAEPDPIRQLKIAENALTAQSRIAATLRKHGLDTGELLDREAALSFFKLMVRALMSLGTTQE